MSRRAAMLAVALTLTLALPATAALESGTAHAANLAWDAGVPALTGNC